MAEEEPLKKRTFEVPESLRSALAEMASQAASQVASSQQVTAMAAKALAQLQPVMEQAAADVARQLAPLQQALGDLPATHRTSAGLDVRSSGSATVHVREVADIVGLTDSVTVSLRSHSTLSAVPEMTVATDDDGDLGEDMYRLVGAVLLQLEDVAEGREQMSNADFYMLLTGTLQLLVALLAWLKPLASG